MILQDILEVLEFIGPERMAIFAENLIKKEECAVGRDKILGHHTRMIICCLETGIFVCSSVYFVLLDASRRVATRCLGFVCPLSNRGTRTVCPS